MREWDADRVAGAAGASVIQRSPAGPAIGSSAASAGPEGVSIDSRTVGPGELFIGLKGERVDGGEHVRQALERGAWGALVAPEHARGMTGGGVVLAHGDPLAGLQSLARAWGETLKSEGARIVAITGSTGKTSTKDIVKAILERRMRTVASLENQNTEIGMPLTMLAAPRGTEALVLEMAMRGKGQIAELARIARPDVGVIVNVGPVHLEQLGSLEGVAAAKAELIEEMAPHTTVIVPAGEKLLERYLRADMKTVTFGAGGEVQLVERTEDGQVVIAIRGAVERIVLRPSFVEEHNLRNLLAAVAVAGALGKTPAGEVSVRFSARRGERKELGRGRVLIEDCYNANPMSMRAALGELARSSGARRVAVLGDMLELGETREREYHREIGRCAARSGVDVLVTVGPLAREMKDPFAAVGSGEAHCVPDAVAAAELLEGLLKDGDEVLVKGSRGVGLERVGQALRAKAQANGN